MQTKRQMERLKQVKARVGLGHTTIYKKISTGDFPKPYALGDRAVGWLSEDIDRWIESRISGVKYAPATPEAAGGQ